MVSIDNFHSIQGHAFVKCVWKLSDHFGRSDWFKEGIKLGLRDVGEDRVRFEVGEGFDMPLTVLELNTPIASLCLEKFKSKEINEKVY